MEGLQEITSALSNGTIQGWNKLWGRGGGPPQISMQWGKTTFAPNPHFLMASLYMVQLKFGDSGTIDSLSLNLRPIYYSFSDHSLDDNF